MNVRTTEGDVADGVADGAEMMSMVVSPIENHSEIPGFTPNVRFTRLGERGLYAAVILPSGRIVRTSSRRWKRRSRRWLALPRGVRRFVLRVMWRLGIR